MNAEVRRKLEMAARARDFTRANPSKDASYAGLLARLEEQLDRAEALAAQQRTGVLAERAAAARRKDLRRAMQSQLLRHLVRVGEAAAKSRPDLGGSFRLNFRSTTSLGFLTAAKAMLATAQAERALLLEIGLAESLLGDLEGAVREFEVSIEAGNAGRRDHVEAGAHLAVVANQLTEAVELIDGLNRYRFSNDSARMAAWLSARNVPGPFRAKPEEPGAAAA